MNHQPTKPSVTGAMRTLALCCALLLPWGLAACGGDGAAPTQTLTDLDTPEPTSNPIDEDTGNEQPMPTDIDFPETTGTHDPELVAAFTPDGATVHADVESMLTLSTPLSFDEMIAFCLATAERIGAHENSIDSAVPGFWTYSGTLEGNMPITVELRDDGDSTALILTY